MVQSYGRAIAEIAVVLRMCVCVHLSIHNNIMTSMKE